jgi:hypothetical protein
MVAPGWWTHREIINVGPGPSAMKCDNERSRPHTQPNPRCSIPVSFSYFSVYIYILLYGPYLVIQICTLKKQPHTSLLARTEMERVSRTITATSFTRLGSSWLWREIKRIVCFWPVSSGAGCGRVTASTHTLALSSVLRMAPIRFLPCRVFACQCSMPVFR